MATARASRYAAATSARLTLARLVHLLAAIVAAILVAGILLVVLKANPSNEIVKAIHDAARFLAGPFNSLFNLSSHRAEVAVNWGIAAIVWYALGRLIMRLLLR
jgi:hypothetical protein